MDNLHLFELINAPDSVDAIHLAVVLAVARWTSPVVAAAGIVAWLRAQDAVRRDLIDGVMTVLIALLIARAVGLVWPHPHPASLHVGNQYLSTEADSGFSSDHVTALWGLAVWALTKGRFAVWFFPLFTLGLVVGWSRVYLGDQFPLDVLAALPLAVVSALIVRVCHRWLEPVASRVLSGYHALARSTRGIWR
jgi:undecaprenyl-diphosphatase